MVKSQLFHKRTGCCANLLTEALLEFGNREAQSQMQLHDTHLFQTARSDRYPARGLEAAETSADDDDAREVRV